MNKGEETISIGQWAIKSIANDKETVYKFHSRQTMKPGDTITVCIFLSKLDVPFVLGRHDSLFGKSFSLPCFCHLDIGI